MALNVSGFKDQGSGSWGSEEGLEHGGLAAGNGFRISGFQFCSYLENTFGFGLLASACKPVSITYLLERANLALPCLGQAPALLNASRLEHAASAGDCSGPSPCEMTLNPRPLNSKLRGVGGGGVGG